MFQQFHTTTIMGGFIKHMLSTTPIPVLDTVTDGDTMIEGCSYIYKEYIIECVRGGVLHVGENEELYPSDQLHPMAYLFPKIGYLGAIYKVTNYFDTNRTYGYTYKYYSKRASYDEDTHYHLGNYLRFLRDCKGLDLMAYYNCYCGKTVDGIYLGTRDGDSSTFEVRDNSANKVFAVPVRFGKTYTVALNCPAQVTCHVAFYGENGLLTDGRGGYLTSEIDAPITTYVNPSYTHPFTVYINPPIGSMSRYMYDRQRYLYLLIQIPASINTSLTVLEGDYTTEKIWRATVSNYDLKYRAEWESPIRTVYNPSLLIWDGAGVLAFSDRLIEYLLNNIIWNGDDITENVAYIKGMMSVIDSYYAINGYKSVISKSAWDDSLGASIANLTTQHMDKIFLTDIDSNVNKDVEEIIYRRFTSELYKSTGGK